jgi:hypothetical protein
MDKELWELINASEEQITDLLTFNKLIDTALDRIENEDEDGAMNTLIGLKQYILHSQSLMDLNVRKLWKKLQTQNTQEKHDK